MREKLSISEERLQACLQEQYDLISATLEFLPLGHDTRAGVYLVVSECGIPYLLKVKLGSLYEPGCLVPRFLHDQGITSVVAPLSTKRHTLWTQTEDWSVIVYPFLDGDTGWAGMTDAHWKEVGSIFKQIHQVVLPSVSFESLRKETFDPTEYISWVHTFETQLETQIAVSEDVSISERVLRASWIAHKSTIHAMMTSMEKLAKVLQECSGPHVVCHADLHPGNLLRTQDGHVFVIDWDDVMLAPRERDFIFVRKAQEDSSQNIPPFFQGYGQTEIDWTALAYYLYERIITDVIAFTQEVFFREDLGEESKTYAAQLFHGMLSKGGMIEEAYAAEAHLS